MFIPQGPQRNALKRFLTKISSNKNHDHVNNILLWNVWIDGLLWDECFISYMYAKCMWNVRQCDRLSWHFVPSYYIIYLTTWKLRGFFKSVIHIAFGIYYHYSKSEPTHTIGRDTIFLPVKRGPWMDIVLLNLNTLHPTSTYWYLDTFISVAYWCNMEIPAIHIQNSNLSRYLLLIASGKKSQKMPSKTSKNPQ